MYAREEREGMKGTKGMIGGLPLVVRNGVGDTSNRKHRDKLYSECYAPLGSVNILH